MKVGRKIVEGMCELDFFLFDFESFLPITIEIYHWQAASS